MIKKLIVFGVLLAASWNTVAGLITSRTISASDSGHYSTRFEHFDGNPNYAVGLESVDSGVYLRNFFVFDLSGVNGQIETATLRLSAGAVGDAADTYSIFDVETDITTLTAPHSRGSDVAKLIYDDLGTGVNFGSFLIPERNFSLVELELNDSAISALNDAVMAGGTNLFALGGTYPDNTANRAFFSTGGTGNTRELVLAVHEVPEPSTIALMALGLAGLGYRRTKA